MGQGSMASPPDTQDRASVRIDKWLWAARFYKTRGLASQAIDAGHVRINGQRCKASREVKPGDSVHITRAPETYEILVLGVSTIRGPAPVAHALYCETDESRKLREELAGLRKTERQTGLVTARPTKRDRRMIQKLKDHGGDSTA